MFTNIPYHNTINICTNLLCDSEDVTEDIEDGVAIGSTLGPTMENVFLSFYEIKWLEQCPKEFKPVFCRTYVNDIFVLFKSAERLLKFRNYFNTSHPNNSFSFEQEKKWKVVIS